jgi:hypothetical protein
MLNLNFTLEETKIKYKNKQDAAISHDDLNKKSPIEFNFVKDGFYRIYYQDVPAIILMKFNQLI